MFLRSVIFALAGAALLGASARAMTMDQFARMKFDDEGSYVTLLVEGSSKYLRQQGKPADADRVIALFKQKGKGGGVDQFAIIMKDYYGQNMHNQINPNNRVPQLLVEDAMVKTLKNNNLDVSKAYLLTLYKGFRPSVLKQLQAAAATQESDTNYPASDAPQGLKPVTAPPPAAGSNWFAPAAPASPDTPAPSSAP